MIREEQEGIDDSIRDACTQLLQIQESRSFLRSTLAKASDLRSGLLSLDKHKLGEEENLPALQSAMVAVEGIAVANRGLGVKIDEALKRSLFLVEVLHAIQAMQKTLTEDEPNSDLRRYLNVVCCLERYLYILQTCYEPAMKSLDALALLLKERSSAFSRRQKPHQTEVLDDMSAERKGAYSASKDRQSLDNWESNRLDGSSLQMRGSCLGSNETECSTRDHDSIMVISPGIIRKTDDPERDGRGLSRRSNHSRVPKHADLMMDVNALNSYDPVCFGTDDTLEQRLIGTMNGNDSCMEKLVYVLSKVRCLNPKGDGSSLLSASLDKLEEEFQQILVNNSSPMNLQVFLCNESPVQEDGQHDSLLQTDVVVKLLAISDRLKVNGRACRCMHIYKETRFRALRKSISSLSPDYLQYCSPDALSHITWEETLNFLPLWIQHLHIIVQVLFTRERVLIDQVLARFEYEEKERCFVSLVQEQSSFQLFFRFPDALALSTHTPERRLCGLLDLFKGVQKIMGSDGAKRASWSGALEVRFQELQKQLVHNSHRAFWELVKKIETYQGDLKRDGGVDLLLSFVVNYLRTLIEFYKAPMEDVLRIRKTWGSEQIRQSDLGPSVVSMMNALAKNLENRVRNYDDIALRYLFLMNNYRYAMLKSKEYPELAQYLGEGFRIEWQRKVQDNARKYIKAGWEKVAACLSSDGKDTSLHDANVMKSKLRAFYAAFEDTFDKHCCWTIADPKLRERVPLSIIQLVIPPYYGFLQYHSSQIQGAAARKCIKFAPEVMQNMLNNLFRKKQG